MKLIGKEDFEFLRGGDKLIQVRNTHMENFCKRYYINKEGYKYYEDQKPTGRTVLVQCLNGTKENPYIQSSIQGENTENRPDGANWHFAHCAYPDECSPTIMTEIKMNLRKLNKWSKTKLPIILSNIKEKLNETHEKLLVFLSNKKTKLETVLEELRNNLANLNLRK